MRLVHTVFMSALLANAACAPTGEGDSPPAPDGDEPGIEAPVPDVPAPDMPAPDVPAPDAPAPDAPAPDAPAPDVPPPDALPPDAPPPDAPVDCLPPVITGFHPADGASGVSSQVTVTVRFDEPVASILPANALLLLDEAGQRVPGTVTIDGAEIRFVPLDDLAFLGSYTALVTTAITDLVGNRLAGDHSFQFSVRDGAWHPGERQLLEHSSYSVEAADVAMDPRGNVAVVWAQYAPPNVSIWATHYSRASGWGTAQLIEHDDAGYASAPSVAMDDAGNAIAVWLQYSGIHTHVWANRYQAGTGWGEPVRLDVNATIERFAPRIAMNPGGTAVVMWREVEGVTRQAWFARYVPGAGWNAAEQVQIDGQPASLDERKNPEIDIDGQGTALVLLHDHLSRLLAVRHHAGSGWGEAEVLSEEPTDRVALDVAPTGYAFATWEQEGWSRIYAWRHAPDGTSRVDVLMDVSASDPRTLGAKAVAVDPAGNGIAMWSQRYPGPRQLWTSVYSAETQTWSAPEGVLPPGHVLNLPSYTQIAMDPRGHAHALWGMFDDNHRFGFMTTRRVAPGGFSVPVAYNNMSANLATNAQGKAVMIRFLRSNLSPEPRIDLDAMFFE